MGPGSVTTVPSPAINVIEGTMGGGAARVVTADRGVELAVPAADVAPGRRVVFSEGQVQLLDGPTILEARARPRDSFAGLRKHRRWSPLDALYFFGYAVTHYHSLPFSLTDWLCSVTTVRSLTWLIVRLTVPGVLSSLVWAVKLKLSVPK